MSAAASRLPVTRFGPMIREYEDAVRDKSYRRTPIGQEAARYLRRLRWTEASPLTIESYEGTYARLALDHDDYSGLADFCTPVGKQYLELFLERHWADAATNTKRQRASAIRSLFAWAADPDDGALIPWNPAAKIRLPRARNTVDRVAYPPAVLHRLVAAQPTLRDQCALQLLCRLGLRKNELRLLKVGEIDLHRNVLLVHGKGRKDALMPIRPATLRDDLYLHVQGDGRHPDEFLLYPKQRRFQSMDPASMHRWFKRCLDRAELPSRVMIHEMRHSAADNLRRASGDVLAAQQLLRHMSLATTETYLHPTMDDLGRALDLTEEGWG